MDSRNYTSPRHQRQMWASPRNLVCLGPNPNPTLEFGYFTCHPSTAWYLSCLIVFSGFTHTTLSLKLVCTVNSILYSVLTSFQCTRYEQAVRLPCIGWPTCRLTSRPWHLVLSCLWHAIVIKSQNTDWFTKSTPHWIRCRCETRWSKSAASREGEKKTNDSGK